MTTISFDIIEVISKCSSNGARSVTTISIEVYISITRYSPGILDALDDANDDGGLPEVPEEKQRVFRNPYWCVPGGWIVYSSEGSLDAHCDCAAHKNPSNPCRLNRGTETADEKRGRPLGLLMAWLAMGHARPTRKLHHNAGFWKSITDADLLYLDKTNRLRGRKWLRDHGLEVLFTFERNKRPDEPEEYDVSPDIL
jgi:hypothetical protein